jgi:hypothetical protein
MRQVPSACWKFGRVADSTLIASRSPAPNCRKPSRHWRAERGAGLRGLVYHVAHLVEGFHHREEQVIAHVNGGHPRINFGKVSVSDNVYSSGLTW